MDITLSRPKISIDWQKLILPPLLLILLAIVLYLSNILTTTFDDWQYAYSPAIRELVNGRTPYTIEAFYSPPWVLIPLLPFYFLPTVLLRPIFALAALSCLFYSGYKFGAKPLPLGVFLLSPPVLRLLINGNIDWIIPLGFVLPPQIGLFFIMAKPQAGAAIALYWLVGEWRKNGWRGVAHVFLPITTTFLASFLIFGLWPLKAGNLIDVYWNLSIWPYGIPLGLLLLWRSISKKRVDLSITASPFLSPYFALYSVIIPLFGLLKSKRTTIAVVSLLWVFEITTHGILSDRFLYCLAYACR